MNHKETLDQVLRYIGWGGRYAHESDPIEPRRAYMEALVDSLHDKTSRFRSKPGLPRPFPEVYAGIADHKAMNACAIRHKDTYYIAVCLGVFDLLTETFIRLLHRADVFPWLGNPPEANSLAHLPPLRRDLASAPPEDVIFTFDRVRMSAASWMGSRALDFLVLHEVRHLTGGHLDYGASALSSNMIVEAATVGAHSERNVIKQALELEADLAAIVGLLETRFGPEPKRDLDLPFLLSSENRPQRVLGLTLAAVTTVLKLFGNPLPDYPDWEKSDHPPDEVRRYAIVNCAASTLKLWGHRELADLGGTVDEILGAVDVALHQLLNDPVTTCDRQTLFGRGGHADAHFRKLVAVRKGIQPEVAPLAFVETLFS